MSESRIGTFAYLLQVSEALFFELKPRDENIWDQVSFGRIKPMFLGFIFGIYLKKKYVVSGLLQTHCV